MTRYSSPRPDPKDLQKFGPRLEIEVGLPIVRSLKGPLPVSTNSSRMPALIDTGATHTVLTPKAIHRLNLPLVGYTILSRAGGKDKVGVHVASIGFPRSGLATIEIVEVACCTIPTDLYECLLGRDILSRWLFTYNGKTGRWSIDEEDQTAWVEPPDGLWS